MAVRHGVRPRPARLPLTHGAAWQPSSTRQMQRSTSATLRVRFFGSLTGEPRRDRASRGLSPRLAASLGARGQPPARVLLRPSLPLLLDLLLLPVVERLAGAGGALGAAHRTVFHA